MAEPIAALIVRILADTAEMVTGVKNVAGLLDTLESRVMKFGKGIAAGFTVAAVIDFTQEIIADAGRIADAAQRVGAGAEEFQRFAFGVKQSGIDAAAAEQGIAMLNARLGGNESGLLNVLRKLNISADEFRDKDPVQRYIDLGVALAGIEDPAERAAARVEALGTQGEKSLAAIDGKFAELAKNAPVYTDEQIASLDRLGDAFDRSFMNAKIRAAEVTLGLYDLGKALADIATTPGQLGDVALRGPGASPTPPGSPLAPPGSLHLQGGVDPNNVKELAVAYADLSLAYTKVKSAAEEAAAMEKDSTEQLKAKVWIVQLLNGEIKNLAGAMVPLMDAFGTTTKVDQFAQRIIDLATRSAELRREQERLLEALSPGSQRIAGDDVDAAIFDLRSDPRNKDAEGNLTPQAFQLESDIINTANLRQAVAMSQTNLVPAASANPSGFSSVVNRVPSMSNFGSVVNPAPANITINAQGSYWRDPQMMNELGRLIEDAVAGRGTGAYSRR